MNTKQKGQLIGAIISHLKFHAITHKKQFKEADIFFSLCFKNDKELNRIAKLAGV